MQKRTLAILVFLGTLLPNLAFPQKSQIGLSLNSPLFLDGNNLGRNSNPFKLYFPSIGIGVCYTRDLENKLFAEASLHIFFCSFSIDDPKLIGRRVGTIDYREGQILNYSVGKKFIGTRSLQLKTSVGLSFRRSWELMITSVGPFETTVVKHDYLGPGLNAGLNFQYRIFKPLYFIADAKLHHFFSYQPKSREQQFYHTRNTIHILNLSAGMAIRFGSKGSVTED